MENSLQRFCSSRENWRKWFGAANSSASSKLGILFLMGGRIHFLMSIYIWLVCLIQYHCLPFPVHLCCIKGHLALICPWLGWTVGSKCRKELERDCLNSETPGSVSGSRMGKSLGVMLTGRGLQVSLSPVAGAMYQPTLALPALCTTSPLQENIRLCWSSFCFTDQRILPN